MPASPFTTPMPEKLWPTIEAEIERLIALLDAIDGDPDLEPSLGFNVLMLTFTGAVDLEDDTSSDVSSMGAIEARLPAPIEIFGGRMQGLFPALREPGGRVAYVSAGFCQLDAWSGPTDARTDEAEPCCEDEGAQCDGDNGIADRSGAADGYMGGPLAGVVIYG
ncbi:MAG: hypothetical protein ACOZAM_23125 [Pseudomonadota bacterium]